MPRPGPRREFTGARFDEATVEALDQLAKAQGVTRSDVIREAVEQYLERQARIRRTNYPTTTTTRLTRPPSPAA